VRRLTFLLKPGWVILALIVAAFAYLCFNVLAPWQLGKNVRTSHRNDLIAASVRADPVAVQALLGPGRAGAADGDEWRRVDITGSYLPDSTVLVRLRSVDDAPAFEVLTALRLRDGRAVLLDRGYVGPAGADAIHPPSPATLAPPTGTVTVAARLRRSEGVIPGKDPITQDGYRQVYSIDSGQVGTLIGTPLVAGYLQTEADQPGAFRPVPLPQLDAGPYLSYGLQWLAFGLMAPLGLAYFIRAEIRERRKERRPDDPVPDGPDPAAPDDTAPDNPAHDHTAHVDTMRDNTDDDNTDEKVPAGTAPALSATEAKLADRYGRRR
jgi:cytochrome oxidase assembly protein ShyY1